MSFLTCLILLLHFSTNAPVSNSESGKCSDQLLCVKATYFNAQRTYVETFSRINNGKYRYSWGGQAVSPAEPSTDASPLEYEPVWVPAYDCSTKRFYCLYGARRVFAVPRDRLKRNQSYIAGGSILKVIKCIKGGGDYCYVALIRSDCQSVKDYDGCKLSKNHHRTKSSGPVLYFIFNRRYGVTSYGSSMKSVSYNDGAFSISTQYILSGDNGIFSLQNDKR